MAVSSYAHNNSMTSFRSFQNASLRIYLTPIKTVSETTLSSPSVDTASVRLDRFISALRQKMLKEVGAAFDPERLTPLTHVLSLMVEEENPAIRAALNKKDGYFVRLFSNESWQGWTESRTDLGKVVGLFADFAEGTTRLKNFMRKLDPQVIQKAIQESEKVLDPLPYNQIQQLSLRWPCITNIMLGLAASSQTRHRLPAVLAAVSCFDQVNAQRGAVPNPQRAAILAQRDQTRVQSGIPTPGRTAPARYGDQSLNDLIDPFQSIKGKLLSELFRVLPEDLEKTLSKFTGNNWIDVVLEGIRNVVVDFTQISAPVNQLEKQLKMIEETYWAQSVYPEYVKIFPQPGWTWNKHGGVDTSYPVTIMREKLKSHGYTIVHGTPVQFLMSLGESGFCDGGGCQWPKSK